MGLWMEAEEAVSTVMADLAIPEDRRGVVLRWMFQANRELQTPTVMEQVTTGVSGEPQLVVPESGRVEKPCNLIQVDKVQFYVDGVCAVPYFEPIDGRMQPQWKHYGSQPQHVTYRQDVTNSGFTYSIQVKEYHDHFKVTNADGLEMVLTYDRFYLDESGLPLFDRDSIHAMKAYVNWQFVTMQSAQMMQVSPDLVLRHRRQYGLEARNYQAIRDARTMNSDSLKQLASRMNNPFIGTTNEWEILAKTVTYAQIFSSYP